MALTYEDFKLPESHPIGLLKNYRNAFEKERMLAFILGEAIEAKDIKAIIKTKYNHPTMVEDNLLSGTFEEGYTLTKEAIGLLYGFYGKD